MIGIAIFFALMFFVFLACFSYIVIWSVYHAEHMNHDGIDQDNLTETK